MFIFRIVASLLGSRWPMAQEPESFGWLPLTRGHINGARTGAIADPAVRRSVEKLYTRAARLRALACKCWILMNTYLMARRLL